MPDMKKMRMLASALKDKATEQTKARGTGKKWYDIRNAGSDAATIYIYDMIGQDPWTGEGVSSSEFVQELSGITAPRIEVHINSEGGEVWEGLAIYESLKQHPAHVTTVVDSLAASAASFIAMAGDTVKMGKRARLMVHDAAIGGAFGQGTADTMREFSAEVLTLADLLDDLSNNVAAIYAEKTGGTAEDWRTKMKAGAGNTGTWFSAQDAVSAGLVDGIIGDSQDDSASTAEQEAAVNAFDVDALIAALQGGFNA